MHRRDFGPWGIELSDDDFACALAALGVLLVHPTLRFEPRPRTFTEAFDQLATDGLTRVAWSVPAPTQMSEQGIGPEAAEMLATAWKESRLVDRVRLEINQFGPLFAGFDPPSTLPWLASTLSRRAVGARSVYVRIDEPSVDVGWQWPLRIGFLDDSSSRALEREFQSMVAGLQWIGPLAAAVDMRTPGAECDLLVLPTDLRSALALVAAEQTPPRADCVAVLGRTQGPSDEWFRLLVGLRAAARTSGVIVADVQPRGQLEWVSRVVRELSHNNPLDVAAFQATRDADTTRALITLSGKLADFSRLTSQMQRMATQLSAPEYRDLALDVRDNSPAQQTLGVWPGSHPLSEIGDRLKQLSVHAESMADPTGFIHETGAATGVAEIATAVAAAMEAAPTTRAGTTPAESRFIQAKVFDRGSGERVERRRSLRADRPHEVVVRIGLPSAEWIAGPADRPFPAEELPPDQDAHELTVIFAEPKLLDDPQLARVTLPRAGNSTECSFHVFARGNEERLDARIIVAFRNRVLQTALLRARISRGDEADREGTIELEPELAVRPALEDLAWRREFGAALVLNHNETGISGITAISDDAVARFTPSQTMNDEVANLDLLLTQIVNDPKSYMGDLESEAVTSMLRQFAQHGSLLYDHIVRDGGLASAGLAGDGPIQVISAVADARLPVEFVYAREAPANDAPLCPNAAASLRRGECDGECTRNGARERDFICPLAFWGLKRTIERHAHDRKWRTLLDGDAYAVLSEPTARRNTLDVLRGGLVATTQRVEKTVAGGTQRICDRITSGTSTSLAPVTTWESWEAQIDSRTPSLLVLIVHTAASPTDLTIQQMEIGVESWLTVANLEARHVRRNDAPPPLVLLLGCETGVSDRQFANFINRIRNRGAAVVIAAGAKIHALHAVPVAAEFVDALRTAVQRDGATLGDVMRDVRREMLARGIPMVLTLSAFGDADWRLTPRT